MAFGGEKGAYEPFRLPNFITHTGPDFYVGVPNLYSSFGAGFGTSGGLGGSFGLTGLGLPNEAYAPGTKGIVASILAALGYGNYEQGVFDAPLPGVYPVLTGPSIIVSKPDPIVLDPDDQPVFLPSWPEEWKKQPGDLPGWDPNQWEYPETIGDAEVAIDWGGVFSGAIDIAQGQMIGGGTGLAAPSSFAQPFPSTGVAMPGKITVDTATGKVTACRRRRRRRLLTPTDLNDLAALKTIVGGGQSMNFAVMKAVRR